MAEPGRSEAPRIAIKFGAGPSNSSKKPLRQPPPSSLGKRPRPRPVHGLGGDDSDDDSADDDHGRPNGRHQRITGFGANGADLEESGREKRAKADHTPLTIARLPNRDWRSEARARRQQQSAPPTQSRSQPEVEPVDEDKPIKWGLNVTKAKPKPEDGDEDGTEKDANRDTKNAPDEVEETKETKETKEAEETKDTKDTKEEEEQKDKKDDIEKAAVEALLGNTADDRTGTRLVIESSSNSGGIKNHRQTEDAVFERDFHDAPDASTLEEYEAMPVEEFGAALLRGMGWDGKDRGPKVKQVQRRPAQLGLGAKELKGEENLGAWNHNGPGGQRRRQRPPKLHDYKREQDKRRERREDRYRDSYKAERDRERERERDDRRRYGSGGGGGSSRRHHSSRYDR